MDRYKIIKEVGDGTFGSVWRAINKQSGEIVAVKKMKKKYYSWEECVNLREVKALQKMNHPNIVKLKEVIRENDNLFFVFEYMECNLYQLMKSREKSFSEDEVRNFCFQIFQALSYMHQRGYFHRDLKPENILVTKRTIKIADLGLAREVASEPPYTEYVSTRWYRAPEVLLQASAYSSAVDMWAMGAIIAELFTLRPLFPGSSEPDEIYKICGILGTPNFETWSEGLQLAQALKFQFPLCEAVHLSMVLPSASDEAIDLVTRLCSWNPRRRPTAVEALQHSFFQPCYYVPPSLRLQPTTLMATPVTGGYKDAAEQRSARRLSEGTIFSSKPSKNISSLSGYATNKAGVRRKLEIDSKLPEHPQQSLSNTFQQSRNRPSPIKAPGHGPTKDSAKSLGEKFSQLYLGSNNDLIPNTRRPANTKTNSRDYPQKYPPSARAGWHSQDDVTPLYVISSTRSLPTRKVF